MNILFVSKLFGKYHSGPNYSVPAQVKAQTQYDSVFWYNLSNVKLPEWSNKDVECKNLEDYPTQRLRDLPKPFDCPDLAVIEEFYLYPFCPLISDLQRANIPYVIIPRSQLTQQAQRKKRWKKKIGNMLCFNKMANHAVAIQYLTEQERKESVSQWKRPCYVLPNGIQRQPVKRTVFSDKSIQATYIGRYEIYQKGLDVMMEALASKQELLRENGFRLSMYGYDQGDTISKLKGIIDCLGIGDIVTLNGPAFGDEKQKILLNTDLFLMTSRFEGHPMGLLEALSYGLPCLVTTGTNMVPEIRKYDAGWTAKNAVDSIGEALMNMVKERALFQQKGKNSVQLADKYSWETIAKKSHEIFSELIN